MAEPDIEQAEIRGRIDLPLYELLKEMGRRETPPLSPFQMAIRLLAKGANYDRNDYLPGGKFHTTPTE